MPVRWRCKKEGEKFTRRALWRVYPPCFVAGLPAVLCGGFTRRSVWRAGPASAACPA